MSKPYDATTRHMITMDPAEWSAYLGHPVADPSRVRVVDSNLSTVTAEVDRVIRLEDPSPWLWHLEFQSARDLGLTTRLHFYSILLHHHHRLPVRTTLVLLRDAADGDDITGLHEKRLPGGEIYDQFRYDVVRLWEQPVEPILSAGLTVLPLAPVARVEPAQVPDVLAAIAARLEREVTPEQANTVWSATSTLMGLRYPPDQIRSFIQGVPTMLFGGRWIEDSSIYQEALQKGEARGEARGEALGRVEEAREFLILQGRKKFGPPDGQAEAEIAALSDLDRLHELGARLLDVESWGELLGHRTQEEAPGDPGR